MQLQITYVKHLQRNTPSVFVSIIQRHDISHTALKFCNESQSVVWQT